MKGWFINWSAALRASIEAELERWKLPYKRFAAIDGADGQRACFQSHLGVLQQGRGEPIHEDDAILSGYTKAVVEYVVSSGIWTTASAGRLGAARRNVRVADRPVHSPGGPGGSLEARLRLPLRDQLQIRSAHLNGRPAQRQRIAFEARHRAVAVFVLCRSRFHAHR